MILSFKHKFIFIKGHKVAGTSIEMALATVCGPRDIVTPILPVEERQRIAPGGHCRNYSPNPTLESAYLALVKQASPEELLKLRPPPQTFYNHMSLREVIACRPGMLDGFRIVCAERSPYAKILSWLNMIGSIAAYREGGEMRSNPSLLQNAFDRARHIGRIDSVRNVDLYRSDDGGTATVLRYETLHADFAAFVKSLDISTLPALPHAKKGLMSNEFDPREVLRRDQIETINEIYADEFRTFGYARL